METLEYERLVLDRNANALIANAENGLPVLTPQTHRHRRVPDANRAAPRDQWAAAERRPRRNSVGAANRQWRPSSQRKYRRFTHPLRLLGCRRMAQNQSTRNTRHSTYLKVAELF